MSSSTVDPYQICATRLSNAPKRLRKNSSGTLNFVIALIQSLGVSNQVEIKKKIKKVKQEFDRVLNVYREIIKNRFQPYNEVNFPTTYEFIQSFASMNEVELFQRLSRRSYDMYIFFQDLIYKPREAQELEALERVRFRAAEDLMSALATAPEEGKEAAGAIDSRVAAMTKLFCDGGALMIGGTPVRFCQLVALWSPQSLAGKKMKAAFLKRLPYASWRDPQALKLSPEITQRLTRYSRFDSFRDFFLSSSVYAFWENMQLGPYDRDLFRDLMERFDRDERLRSDACYFSCPSKFPRFYELNLDAIGRSSRNFLKSLQLFAFLQRVEGFDLQENKMALFIMLLHLRDDLNVFRNIPGFQERTWDCRSYSAPHFLYAWEQVERLTGLVYNVEVNYRVPNGCREFLRNPHTISMILFLWEHPNREVFVQTFEGLAPYQELELTLERMYGFSMIHLEREVDERFFSFFVAKYLELVRVFQEAQVQLRKGASIYLCYRNNPGVEDRFAIRYDEAPKVARRFIQSMRQYQGLIPMGSDYRNMLRQFIFHPNFLLFDLLEDFREIGIEAVTPYLLRDVLLRTHEPMGGIVTEEVRREAAHYCKDMQEKYQLENIQIFSVYLGVIRKVLTKQSGQVQQTVHLLDQILAFCPTFAKKDIYFILQYFPDVTPQEFGELVRMRERWAGSEGASNHFVIPRSSFEQINQSILALVDRMGQCCEDIEFRSPFIAGCTKSLVAGFFPDPQPLTDFLRIENISSPQGAHWADAHAQTHEGQLIGLIKNAPQSVYLSWHWWMSYPTLFISFVIPGKGAFSQFVPLYIPISEIDRFVPKEFYGVLNKLCRQLLREEPDTEPKNLTSENPEDWAACYRGGEEAIREWSEFVRVKQLRPQYVVSVWGFIKALKFSYRRLSFCLFAREAPVPQFPSYEPYNIASHGYIFYFEQAQRGCLIPETSFRLERNKHWYTTDASQSFVEECNKRFQVLTGVPTELGLEMVTFSETRTEVLYHVETFAQRLGAGEGEAKATVESATPLDLESFYVTLSTREQFKMIMRYEQRILQNPEEFRKRFDVHCLYLKALIYRMLHFRK